MADSKQFLKDRINIINNELTEKGAKFELSTLNVAGRSYRVFKNAHKTIGEMLALGRTYHEKTAIIFENEKWSYDNLYQKIDIISSQLKYRYGVCRGDRIAIAMRNCPEWIGIFIAIVSTGAIAVPINSFGKTIELMYGIEDSDAKIVFCDYERYVHISEKISTTNIKVIVTRTSNETIIKDHTETFESFILEPEIAHKIKYLDIQINPDDIAVIIYSSGTTGQPKGVIWTHRNLTQAMFCYEYLGALIARLETKRISQFASRKINPANLLATPLFHGNGLCANALLSIYEGQKLVIMYKWDVDKAIDYIEKEQITSMKLSPAMTLQLIDSDRFSKADISSLFNIGSGGSATPLRINNLLFEKYPEIMGSGGYGTTETTGPVAALYGDAYLSSPTCAGPVTVLFDVKICDEHDQEVLPGETGEVHVRGVAVAQGYWRKPEATKKAFINGWYRTGDIGYIDDYGFLYITDRITDMVIRGGENIYCAEVENILYGHPAVAEVAAFGVNHSILGEELAVAVRLKPKTVFSAIDIQNYMKSRVAKYKVPEHIFLYNEELPKGPTGKILKREIRRFAEINLGKR